LGLEFAHASVVGAEFVVRHGHAESIADLLAVAAEHILDGLATVIAPGGKLRVEFGHGLRLFREILFFDLGADVILAAQLQGFRGADRSFLHDELADRGAALLGGAPDDGDVLRLHPLVEGVAGAS
jgi:hypothetical protein